MCPRLSRAVAAPHTAVQMQVFSPPLPQSPQFCCKSIQVLSSKRSQNHCGTEAVEAAPPKAAMQGKEGWELSLHFIPIDPTSPERNFVLRFPMDLQEITHSLAAEDCCIKRRWFSSQPSLAVVNSSLRCDAQ